MKHNPPALRFVLLALLLFWLPLWGANCTAGGQVDGPSSPEQTLVIVDGATTPDDLVLPEHTQGKDRTSGHKERNCDPVDCVSPPAATCLPSGKRRAYEPNGSCHPIDDKCVY